MSEFNPLRLIEEAVKQGYDPGAVSDIDERQLPWAKNVVEWIMDPTYLDVKRPFPLQIQTSARLFGDACAYCSDWEFYQKDWDPTETLGNIMSKMQWLEDGKCPRCKKTRLDQYHDKLFHFPDEADILWGMRSSKSSLCGGFISTYILHRFLRLADPAVHFGLLPGSVLYMRFVAMTVRQAKQSNWMYFSGTVRRCAWFNIYHDFMSSFSRKKGIELVRWVQESFAYVHKGIEGYLVGSGNYDVERGRTAAYTNIDELGLFDGDIDSTQFNPYETYTTYEKSSMTVRNAARKKFLAGDYNTPTAWMVAQSSTKSKADYIMRLIKQGKTDPTKVTSHKASWEVNPELEVDFLENEKKKDPRSFDRDYGSIPPFSDDPFIDNEELVMKSAVVEPKMWNVKQERIGQRYHLSAASVEQAKNIPYCLSIDMGRTECGYAAALLKLKEDDFSVVQVAGLWGLYVLKPNIVDFDSMFTEFVQPLCEKLNVRLVLYDQWQSMAHIDALSKLKIDAMQYSMTYKDFLSFRGNLYQGKLETAVPESTFEDVERSSRPVEELLYERPNLHLLWQMLSVSEVGTKLTKGRGHDDIFRAVSLGCTFLWDPKFRKTFEYKGGMALHTGRTGEGGLVIHGGSRSGMGQKYLPNYNRRGNQASIVSASTGTIGSFLGRTKKDKGTLPG